MIKEIIKETLENGTIRYGYYDSHNDFIFHRDEKDGPAFIGSDGTQEWYINDKIHREDGPAIIHADGTKYWYVNDKRHREDGPALIHADGTQEWYINDKRHREDGPALIFPDERHSWVLEGNPVSCEVEEWLTAHNISDYTDMTEEDKFALTFFMMSLI